MALDANLSTKMEFFVSCKNLSRNDLMSKSDPFVTFELANNSKGKEWIFVDQSETIYDNQSPEFAKRFEVDYMFEELQTIRLTLYDEDEKNADLSKQDYCGELQFTLAELASAKNQTLQKHLIDKKHNRSMESQIIVRAEEVSTCKQHLNVVLKGVNLDKKDMFGKSDPYLEFYRIREDGSWVKVHQTEVQKNTLNPIWKRIEVSVTELCNGDLQRPLLLKCFDWDSSSDPDFIGQVQITGNDLLKAGAKFALINEKKKAKKGKSYANSGCVVVDHGQLFEKISFLDYIRGGCNIGMMVAIDFTGSNGDPSSPQSLHFLNAGLNQYQTAIRSIGNIVAPYDSDQRFPVWGFGAKVNGAVKHCFPLTFDDARPEVIGVDGILDVYTHAMDYVQLSGPTLFSEILQNAAALASQPFTPQHQHYSILLILTDGVINDLANTCDLIVAASKLPLSIIIVGVGDADFDSMEVLDGDSGALKSSSGEHCQRDIVQFVPLRKFSSKSAASLAKETLAEVPKQLLSFMNAHGIRPQAIL